MFVSKFNSILLAMGLLSTTFAGCVSGSGSSAAVAEFDLIAGFHTEESQLSNGHFVDKTQNEIALNKLTLHLAEISLVTKTASGGNGQTFDPSNPPEPYENCHANHCHIKGSSDTKTFAEIEAELSGGEVTSKAVLVMTPDKTIELTSLTTPIEIEGVAGGDLPYGEINEIHVVFDTFSLSATNVTAQKEITLNNEHKHDDHVHVEPLELSHGVDIDIVQGSEEDQDIHLILEIDADILGEISGDDVDFADLMAEYTLLELEDCDHDHDHDHGYDHDHH